MAKLIATDGKLRTLDRTIVTDANGAPCCCDADGLGRCQCNPRSTLQFNYLACNGSGLDIVTSVPDADMVIETFRWSMYGFVSNREELSDGSRREYSARQMAFTGTARWCHGCGDPPGGLRTCLVGARSTLACGRIYSSYRRRLPPPDINTYEQWQQGDSFEGLEALQPSIQDGNEGCSYAFAWHLYPGRFPDTRPFYTFRYVQAPQQAGPYNVPRDFNRLCEYRDRVNVQNGNRTIIQNYEHRYVDLFDSGTYTVTSDVEDTTRTVSGIAVATSESRLNLSWTRRVLRCRTNITDRPEEREREVVAPDLL